VRPAELGRSSYFRFAIALTALFLAAYLVAGVVAFRAISTDLESRVIQAVELSIERYEDIYDASGPAGLIAAADTRAGLVDADDEFIWVGSVRGETLAGQEAPHALSLSTGYAAGTELGAEPEDEFWIVVRDFGDLRLISGRSFEESDAIGRAVLAAFGAATGLILLLAGISAALLARRAQQRLDRISNTLVDVSQGRMHSRVPVVGSADDLDRLSGRINAALGQLETTVEGIRQVSVAIAHDLRTPLSRLRIHLEALLDDAADDPALSQRLETASRELKQITANFDALLRIAQIEAGARKSRFRAVDLGEIAGALYEAYLPVAEENDQRLALGLADNARRLVHGDRDLLMQLMANLLENAMRHSPAGTQILIEAGSTGPGVWLSVSDNGPGIPHGERENVLQRFYRLDQSRGTPGSGLGLALVKAIADLHGATLQLADNHPGLVVRLTFDHARESDAA
jgi:signal transduction histidine kinase